MKRPFRLIVWMLCVMMLVPLLSPAALADDSDEPAVQTDGDFDYVIDENGTVTITACSLEVKGKVKIPSKIGGKKVTALGDGAFIGCDGMTEVSIPNGIKTIGKECFLGCPLTSVSIPASVETIGSAAFSTKTLTSLTVNKNNKKFSSSKGVLFNKKKTSVVCFPAGKSGSYTLPDTVKTIRARSFEGSALTELKISGKTKLATIGNGAFSGSALTRFTFPKTVTELGKKVFADCADLRSVKLSDGITEIPDGTFSGCTSLTDLNLTSKVTSIGEKAFAGSGLESISIPTNIDTISDRAFADCTSLQEIIFDHESKNTLTFGKEVFACSGDTETTVRVPDPKSPASVINEYDWKDDNRTVSWGQNENLTVRTVQLSSAESVDGGVKVSWKTIKGADGYIVYRKAAKDEKWSRLATTAASSYKDTTPTSGKTYYYTVRAEKDGFKSRYDPDGLKVKYIAVPVLTSAYNTEAGITVTWGKVGGVSKYRVFRKLDNGGWTRLADTSATSYTDRSVVLGKKYTYTVRCITEDGADYLSDYNRNGISSVYFPLPTPSVKKLTASDGGVKVEWDAVKGASKYRVFRKVGSGSWVSLTDTTATSYQDSSAAMGTAYTYTVRCVSADGKTYLSNYTGGSSITRVGTPALISASNIDGGVEVKWNKVSGAVKYRVFRRIGSETWKTLGDTTGTSWIDKSAKSGTKYSYTVRCLTADGKFFASDYDHNGKAVTYVAAPVLRSVEGSGSGVKITWSSVKGAAKYRVFRKSGTSGWNALGETTGTSFTDSTAAAGKTYSYTVRCLDSGGAYASGYDHTGLVLPFAATPALQSVQKVSGGVQIKWSKATGAVRYRVFRKTGGSGWKTLGETTGTSWVDKTAPNGTLIYTVRPITSNGKYFAGGYNSAGLTITYTK